MNQVWIQIPESDRTKTVLKMKEMLKDPGTEVLHYSDEGVVLKQGKYTLSLTKTSINFGRQQ